MAPWGLSELILRRIDMHLAGANWQRGGGKGQKPKPIELPDSKGRGAAPKTAAVGADLAQRLRNLGLIPPGDSDGPAPPVVPPFDE